MYNTILIKNDKSLVASVMRPIFEGENRADEIRFLFDTDFVDFIDSDSVIMLQAILPYPDEETGKETSGKMRRMVVNEELYKNKYEMDLPINTVLTKAAGDVILWFMFFNVADPNHIKLAKTEPITLSINSALQGSSSIIDDDETYDILAQMQHEITELQEGRMDKEFDYDSETQTIQFYSNGEPYGAPVALDTEVTWRNWD